MVVSLRKREILFREVTGTGTTRTIVPPSYFETKYPNQIKGKQETASEDHPEWRTRRLLYQAKARGQLLTDGQKGAFEVLRNRDIGGAFTTSKNFYWGSHDRVFTFVAGSEGPNHVRTYYGPFFAKGSGMFMPASLWPAITAPTLASMNADGTKAIARTIPTNPVASLAVTLGELKKDGMPSLPGRSFFKGSLTDYRKIGSEYLNLEFGWKPLISDVRKLHEAVRDSDQIIAQYVRDSGRLIRRRYDFPTTTVTEVTDEGLASPTPALPTPMYLVSTGRRLKTRVTTTRRWFKGAYTYYLDPGITDAGRARRNEQIANKLYGSRVNPEVIWNLAPWSWLVDWVSNVGDVMTNLSAFSNDGLVLRWGYMMYHQTIVDTYTINGIVFKSGPIGTVTQVFTTEYKTRVKATPYGFGLNPAAFSTRQWAILAALGISRGPRQL